MSNELKVEELNIDDVRYVFSDGDFFKAEKHARKLLGFADNIVEMKTTMVDGVKTPDFNLNLGAVLANLGDERFEVIRDFIFENIHVVKDGEGVPFVKKSDQGAHLSRYRSHYTQILIAGLKFHFLAFLPNGEAFAKTILGTAINRAVAKLQA